MRYEACPKCGKVVIPNASTSLVNASVVCTCTTPRDRATMLVQPVQPVQVETGIPVRSELESLYLDILCEYASDLPTPIAGQCVIPGRKFEVDFQFPPPGERLIVEIEGNVHRIQGRFQSDAEKYNLLSLSGFVLLRFTGRMLRHQKIKVVEFTRRGWEIAKGKN